MSRYRLLKFGREKVLEQVGVFPDPLSPVVIPPKQAKEISVGAKVI
jgi:hypothetical protein